MLVMIDAHLLRPAMEMDDEVGVEGVKKRAGKCQAFRADWEGTRFARAGLPVRLNTIIYILIIDKMASVSLPKSLEYVMLTRTLSMAYPEAVAYSLQQIKTGEKSCRKSRTTKDL